MSDSDLPQAVVARIVRASLPDKVQCAKDAREALARATKVFVSFLASSANDICRESKRQTISAKDVEQALVDADFAHFVAPLQELLRDFQAEKARKRARNGAEESEQLHERDAKQARRNSQGSGDDAVPAEGEAASVSDEENGNAEAGTDPTHVDDVLETGDCEEEPKTD